MPKQFDDRTEEDAELEASMQEAELRRLQVDYRRADKERNAYYLEATDVIRRQTFVVFFRLVFSYLFIYLFI